MCVNCHDMNNIVVKYKYLFSMLNDMLDELHGSYIFIKIDLKMDIIRLK